MINAKCGCQIGNISKHGRMIPYPCNQEYFDYVSGIFAKKLFKMVERGQCISKVLVFNVKPRTFSKKE